MRLAPIALAATLCATLGACGHIERVTDSLTLTEANDGQTVSVVRHSRFRVELAANVTTGYSWTLGDLPAGVVETVGAGVYAPDAAPAGMVGSGGRSSWTFAAKKPGRETIRLEYRRAWEKDQPAAKTVSFVVDVK
ncbi:MAG: protease inhibitor I42 family protein [Planctomycetes bacterium]|nr:protease inhibitor I42 family protein [Planctomycetota bacterium]